MSVVKKKKQGYCIIEEFSFKEINTFDNVPFDNEFRNTMHGKKTNIDDVEEYLRDYGPYHEKFPTDDPLIEPEDFTEEVKQIQDEMAKQKDEVEKLEQEGEDYSFDLSADDGDSQPSSITPVTPPETSNDSDQDLSDINYHIDDSVEKVNVGNKLFHEALNDTVKEENEHAMTAQANLTGGDVPFNAQDLGMEEQPIPNVEQPVPPQDNMESMPQEPSAINEEELQRIYDEGREKGFQSGYDAGFASGEDKGYMGVNQRVQTLFSKVGELLEELESLKQSVYEEVEETFKLVVEKVTKRVIRSEMKSDPEVLKKIFNDVVEKTVPKEKIKVRVNPEDAEFFSGMVPELKERFKDLELTELIPDAAVLPGDFSIETETSIIDSKVAKQVDHMLDQLDFSLPEKKVS